MIKSCGRSRDNYFTKICSGSEAGLYLGLIDFAYHSTLGLRVTRKKKERKERSAVGSRSLVKRFAVNKEEEKQPAGELHVNSVD